MALINKYDVYNKIIKVINSCKNYMHIINTMKLINNFEDLYKDEHLTDILRTRTTNKCKHL